MFVGEDNRVHCTGSVITRKLILTAGHCFSQGSPPKENLKIVYGINDLADLDISFKPKEIRTIKKVTLHENFVSPRAYSDIALVEVNKRVTFSQEIFPVCLPNKEYSNKSDLNNFQAVVVCEGGGKL